MGPGDFAGLVAEGSLTTTIKVLDSAIEAAEQQHAAAVAKLAQLHINRGLCQQRLGMNRKALKAGAPCSARNGRGSMRTAWNMPPQRVYLQTPWFA
jgi:hypothetical protein